MIGNNFDTPIMYQDLANSTMSPFSMPIAPATSYLGGVRLPRQLDHDKLEIINKKEKQDKKNFKKALILIGSCLALGFIPGIRKNITKAGGIGKYISNKWTSFKNWISGTKTPKPSLWQRFKGLFKKKTTP